MMKGMGGDKSAGFGACDMDFAGDIKIDSASVMPSDLIELTDCLELYEGA
jgi:hypothetical protein